MPFEFDETPEETPAAPPPKSNTNFYLLAGGGLVLLLLVVGVTVLLLVSFSAPEQEKSRIPSGSTVQTIEDPDHILPGAIIDLGELTVNLGHEERFIIARIAIEFFDFAPPRGFDRQEGAVRDAAIDVLSKKNSDELVSLKGREKLRIELIKAINAKLDNEDNPIIDVYFLDFFVQ